MTIIKKLFTRSFLLCVLISLACANASELKPDEAILLAKGKELSINAAQVAAMMWLVGAAATITHEWGHAGAAMALLDLTGSPQVHIGSNGSWFGSTDAPWFSLGNTHFYKTFPWFGGHTNYGSYRYKLSDTSINAKHGVITAAGGATAALFLTGCLGVITTYCAYEKEQGLKPALWQGIKNIGSPFQAIITAEQLSHAQKRLLINTCFCIGISLIFNIFYGLTPYPLAPGDGTDLWEKYIGVTGTPLTALKIMSLAGAWGSWLWLAKKYYDAHKQLATQRINL